MMLLCTYLLLIDVVFLRSSPVHRDPDMTNPFSLGTSCTQNIKLRSERARSSEEEGGGRKQKESRV